MSDAIGEKRERIEELLHRGLRDQEIAARVGCSRTWVVGVRKALGMEPRARGDGRRDRIEQAIARGEDDAAIARAIGVPVERVAEVRASMEPGAEHSPRLRAEATSRGGNRYRAAKAAGLCPRCHGPLIGDRSRCLDCMEAVRAMKRASDARLKQDGRCVDCRAGLALFVRDQRWPHVRCPDCHERNRVITDRYYASREGRTKHRARMAALYQRRRQAGLCVRCEAPSPDRSICEACRPRVKAAQIAYLDRKEAARGA